LRHTIPIAELDGESVVAISLGEQEVVVCKVGEEFFVLDATCTHAGAWLGLGTLSESTYELECPLHGGAFDLRTGGPTRPPCTTGVSVFPARTDHDVVVVDVPEGGVR
jgi:nitrite reductase/ring-hydroxylating ferredoxin subunit